MGRLDTRGRVITVRQSLKRTPGGMVPAELKTASSRRTLAMPEMVTAVLDVLRRAQAAERLKAAAWEDHGLVFAGPEGRGPWPQDIRREFARLCERAGIGRWQLRETRHTFVSALSDAGVDIERIADAVGYVNSTITRGVYRHSLADKITETATVMDRLYPQGGGQ
ncbi:MAG: tyrosine-type recombinase/integrase [Streptosporangiaceae bacterium]